VEAAILIETGSFRRFSRLILTVCRPEQQIERAMKRAGLLASDDLGACARIHVANPGKPPASKCAAIDR